MLYGVCAFLVVLVALLAEGVDRNIVGEVLAWHLNVALLAEGMDRNRIYKILRSMDGSRPPRGGRG